MSAQTPFFTLVIVLLLALICATPAEAQSHRTLFIGKIGTRRAQLRYEQLHGHRDSYDGWLAFEGDTVWYQLTNMPNLEGMLMMRAVAHVGEGLDLRAIVGGQLEGHMQLGLGRFEGFWYGIGGDTARVRMELAVHNYPIRIAPIKGLVSEWELPIFLPGETLGLGAISDLLNGELHNWMDKSLAMQIDSFHVTQAMERREYEAGRWPAGATAPTTNRHFKVRGSARWCSRELVSVMLDCSDTYANVRTFESWTYQITGDTIRRLAFADLFRKGADVRRMLYQWKKRTARHPADSVFAALLDPSASDSAYQNIVRSFIISPAGISFSLPDLFDGFGVLGPYNGFEVPYRELKSIIDPEGPLGRIVAKIGY
jgi:hypothetical protein